MNSRKHGSSSGSHARLGAKLPMRTNTRLKYVWSTKANLWCNLYTGYVTARNTENQQFSHFNLPLCYPSLPPPLSPPLTQVLSMMVDWWAFQPSVLEFRKGILQLAFFFLILRKLCCLAFLYIFQVWTWYSGWPQRKSAFWYWGVCYTSLFMFLSWSFHTQQLISNKKQAQKLANFEAISLLILQWPSAKERQSCFTMSERCHMFLWRLLFQADTALTP